MAGDEDPMIAISASQILTDVFRDQKLRINGKIMGDEGWGEAKLNQKSEILKSRFVYDRHIAEAS